MGIDAPTLIALVVSFVALFVTMIQMIQQLFSTASNYQRCSRESIGGWAKCTHRRFRWNEFRFRVMFSTPRISIDLPLPRINIGPPIEQSVDTDSWSAVCSNCRCFNWVPQRPAQREGLQGSAQSSATYCLKMLGKQEENFSLLQSSQSLQSKKPWFLNAEMVVSDAKCSWLALLQDTLTLRDVKVVITEKQNSYDYLPEGVTRPIASADRKSFLTLMSLFGIQWKSKGKDGHFSGAGEFCELTVANFPYLGDVFVYQDKHRQRAPDASNPASNYDPCKEFMYELKSEEARRAMFHHFDLGDFASFRTHNEIELEESLSGYHFRLDNDTVKRVVSFYKSSGEWCPGLSEAITCWAYESMPKVVYPTNNKFKSRFSAVSARSLTTGSPMFVAMLLGGRGHRYESRADEISSVGNVTNWAREYLGSLETQVKNRVENCLRFAVTLEKYKNIIVDLEVPWESSTECLTCIQDLDDNLENHLLEPFQASERRAIKCTMVNKQITYGSSLSTDTEEESKRNQPRTWWTDEFDTVGANNYIKIVRDLQAIESIHSVHVDEILAQKIVINRMMRGSLWVMHNGNAPDQQSRVLECSLSSSWLDEGNPTVYIS